MSFLDLKNVVHFQLVTKFNLTLWYCIVNTCIYQIYIILYLFTDVLECNFIKPWSNEYLLVKFLTKSCYLKYIL